MRRFLFAVVCYFVNEPFRFFSIEIYCQLVVYSRFFQLKNPQAPLEFVRHTSRLTHLCRIELIIRTSKTFIGGQ